MLGVIEGIFIVLLCSWIFYIGYKLARVEDNNYSELFMGYIRENNNLEHEKEYWKELHRELYTSIPSDMVEDEILNSRGDVISIIPKKKKK